MINLKQNRLLWLAMPIILLGIAVLNWQPAGASGTPTETLYGTNYNSNTPTANSVIVTYGGTTELSWTFQNMNSCEISGSNGDLFENAQTYSSTPTSPIYRNTQYTLACGGTDGTTYYSNLWADVVSAPTNNTYMCSSDQSQITLNWALPNPYNLAYVRANRGSDNYTLPARAVSADGVSSPNGNGSYTFNVAPGQVYTYWVETEDSSGAASNQVGGDIDCSQPPVNGACGRASGVNFAYGTGGYGQYTQCSDGTPTNTNFPSPNTTLLWDCLGSGGGSNTTGGACNASQQPGPPANGNSNNITNSQLSCPAIGIQIQWNPGADGTNSYDIYRSVHGSGIGPIYSTTTGQSFTDTSTTQGVYYDYWVQSDGSPQIVAASSTNGNGAVANTCAGPGPTSVTIDNSSCGPVALYWSKIYDTRYNIYRNTTDVVPASPVYTSVRQGTPDSPFLDSGVFPGNTYYYWVTAIVNDVETLPTASVPDSISPFACSANLSSSNKEITAVNGNSVFGSSGNNYVCEGQSNPLPLQSLLQNGDVLSFQVNVCNNSNSSWATATVSSIVDTLDNLQMPSNGWNAVYCQGVSCASLSPVVTGTVPNQSLSFRINQDVPYGPNATPGILTYNAQIYGAASVNYNHLQNSALINYTDPNAGSQFVNTPLILFYSGGSNPTRLEVAP